MSAPWLQAPPTTYVLHGTLFTASKDGLVVDSGGETRTDPGLHDHFFSRFEELDDSASSVGSHGKRSSAVDRRHDGAVASDNQASGGSRRDQGARVTTMSQSISVSTSGASLLDQDDGKEGKEGRRQPSTEEARAPTGSDDASLARGRPPSSVAGESTRSGLADAAFRPRSQASTSAYDASVDGETSSFSAAYDERVSRSPSSVVGSASSSFRPRSQAESNGLVRPPSPSASALSVDPSTLSTSFTQVSLQQAARNWTSGTTPRPLRRDGVVDGVRALRSQPIVGIPRQGVAGIFGTHPPQTNFNNNRFSPRGYPPFNGSGFRPGAPGVPPQRQHMTPLQRIEHMTARNMEIRVSNIPEDMRKDALVQILASVLHSGIFARERKSPEEQVNFWLHMPRAREVPGQWAKENDGFAFLSLPNVDLFRKFMENYGRGGRAKPIRIPGRQNQNLVFEAGQHEPPAGLVEWLNRVAFPTKNDPTERARLDAMATRLVLSRLEFGVFCKDGTFSPEYAKSMRDSRISIDPRRKELRLSLVYNGSRTGDPPSTRLIVVKSGSVRLLLASEFDGEFSITMILQHPPAYEELQVRGGDDDDDDDVEYSDAVSRKIKRSVAAGRCRSPAFDFDHQKTASHTSRAIRWVFDVADQMRDFEALLNAIRCEWAKNVEMEIDAKQLYRSREKQPLETWLRELESRAVAFQLAKFFQNNLLTPREIMSLQPTVMRTLQARGPFVTADLLHQYVEELTRLEDRWLDRISKGEDGNADLAHKADLVGVLEELTQKGLHRTDWRANIDSPIMQCLHVIMTPTSMILEGPYPDQSNRPLRKYGHHDHFVRVAFMDEDRQPYHWSHDIDWTEFLEARVKSILISGIRLAGRKYQFLGYSMSSLRNRSTWFCTPFEWEGQQVDAKYIREHLGDFEKVKRQPARYGARMAQAFTATDPSLVLKPEQIEEIDDIAKVYRGEEVCFTDGVGKISLALTKKVWAALNHGMEPIGVIPSALQFRLGGYKGVLAVDSTLEGEKICVRPSQQKFDAPDSLGLEIAYTYTRHMYMFLNRPLIKVLEDLQVPEEAFMAMLTDAISHAQQLKQYTRETRRQLTLHGLGMSFGVTELVEAIANLLRTNKLEPFKEGGSLSTFIANSLEYAEVHILRLLKHKARIPVPNAHVGVAIADESGTLKEGEIYTLRHNPGENPEVVEGPVLLVRAPTVDVGDVQMARAVGTPPPGAERFKWLPNTVIFSTQGVKPLLNDLSRGDMDGDLVSVISDRRLFPKQTEIAMQHKPKTPNELDRDCTIEDVIDFVVSFFRNDMIGQIASRHLTIADQAPSGFQAPAGTRHPSCKKLAALQTIAVDAPKSGQAVNLNEIPKLLFPHRPDFMAFDNGVPAHPDEDSLIYESNKILGKLFRSVSIQSRPGGTRQPNEIPNLDGVYVPGGENDHILLALTERLAACGLATSDPENDIRDREEAWYAMHTYAGDLRHVAWSNTLTPGHPLTEEELFIGMILNGSLINKTKTETIARINMQCKELVDNVLAHFEGKDGRDRPQKWANRVLAALRVAVSQAGKFGAHTFGALAIRSTCYLLIVMEDVRKASGLPSSYEYVDPPFEPVNGHEEEEDQDPASNGWYPANGGGGAEVALESSLQGDTGDEGVNWGARVQIDHE